MGVLLPLSFTLSGACNRHERALRFGGQRVRVIWVRIDSGFGRGRTGSTLLMLGDSGQGVPVCQARAAGLGGGLGARDARVLLAGSDPQFSGKTEDSMARMI